MERKLDTETDFLVENSSPRNKKSSTPITIGTIKEQVKGNKNKLIEELMIPSQQEFRIFLNVFLNQLHQQVKHNSEIKK